MNDILQQGLIEYVKVMVIIILPLGVFTYFLLNEKLYKNILTPLAYIFGILLIISAPFFIVGNYIKNTPNYKYKHGLISTFDYCFIKTKNGLASQKDVPLVCKNF